MSKVSIVLVDADEKYLTPLESKFLNEFGDKAEIKVITEQGYLTTLFSTPQTIDLFIINETFYDKEFEKHHISSIFIMTENQTNDDAEVSEDSEEKRIYKYTGVKEIFNEIINSASAKVIKSLTGSEETKVIMVYSPIGGIGKTYTALSLSGALAKAHKKVFYLSIDSMQSFAHYLSDKKQSYTDFERSFALQDDDLLDHLEDAIGHEVFDYLLPFQQSASALNIKMESFRYFINLLKATKKYDYIVADASTEFTASNTMMIGSCDRAVIVAGQNEMDAYKLDQLLLNIDYTDKNKFIFVCNKYDEEKPDHLGKSDVLKKISISEYISQTDVSKNQVDLESMSVNKHFQKIAYMFI